MLLSTGREQGLCDAVLVLVAVEVVDAGQDNAYEDLEGVIEVVYIRLFIGVYDQIHGHTFDFVCSDNRSHALLPKIPLGLFIQVL